MRLVVGVVALVLLGCVSPETNLLEYPLTSGETLEEHLPALSPAVALLFEPADLDVCGNHISRWMEWDRTHPGHLLIVLTKIPTAAERKQLLLFRINPDGVLRRSRGFEPIPTLSEYVIADGEVVLSKQVPAGSPESPILIAFERGQVASLLKAGRTHVR